MRTHLRLLTCSALTALAVGAALLAPAGASAAQGPFVRTDPASAITPTTATLNGVVDPGNRDTDYFFIWGTTSYSARTPTLHVAAGAPALVSAPLAGLAPGTVYHFRLFAFHPGHLGERELGADQAFTTAPTPTPAPVAPAPAALPTAPPPAAAVPPTAAALGTTMIVAPVTGTVRVKAPGAAGFTTLAAGAAIPVGALIDTRSGTVALTTALTGGRTQTATFHSGIFQVRQAAKSGGMTDIFLRGAAVSCSPSRSSARAAAVAKRKRPRRQLWGRDNGGRFRTHGKNSVATVRGTSWVTTDTCSGTRTTVRAGSVSVRDEHRHRTVVVRAGHSYLARRR